MNKTELRKIISKKRALLTKEEVTKKSTLICRNLINTEAFMNAKRILCYINIKNEVMTEIIFNFCFDNGKKIAAPKVNGKTMDFYYVSSMNDLLPGAFGIPEPTENQICTPEKNDIIIMPGLAFDITGNRIGYGGGYYDKYLEIHNDIKKIAVAYDFQLTDVFETEKTDIKTNLIITEERIINASTLEN